VDEAIRTERSYAARMTPDPTGQGAQIRLALECDLEAAAAMSRDLVEHGFGWHYTPGRLRAAMRASDFNLAIGANPDPQGGPGRVVGFGMMQYLDEDAHLTLLAVAQDWQRRGLATRLVRWLERCALTAGIGIVSLEVRATNETALAFYASLGYRPVMRLAGYYQGREDALRLSRDLWFQPVDREPDRSPPQPG
jgi:ribosomal-protein-alanine N-acetyltransferase